MIIHNTNHSRSNQNHYQMINYKYSKSENKCSSTEMLFLKNQNDTSFTFLLKALTFFLTLLSLELFPHIRFLLNTFYFIRSIIVIMIPLLMYFLERLEDRYTMDILY